MIFLDAPCEDGWVYRDQNKRCYKVSLLDYINFLKIIDAFPAQNAIKECHLRGVLTSIHSKEENQFIHGKKYISIFIYQL